MKLLLIKLLLLFIPFVLYLALIAWIDPYNLINISHSVQNTSKFSANSNEYLWKLIEYKNKPVNNILLGDSRVAGIDVNYIKKLTGETYYNLACSGASLPDIIDTFWFATKHGTLNKVYIGLNVNLFNANFNKNDVGKVEYIINNKLLYCFDINVITSIYNIIRSNSDNNKLNKTDMHKHSYWDYYIGPITNRFYSNYVYNNYDYDRLQAIKKYCDKNNILLTLIIMPTHVDLQNKIKTYHLTNAEKLFKNNIIKLGNIFDFDYINEITSNKEYYSDPYHLLDTKIIIDEVWGKHIRSAKVYK